VIGLITAIVGIAVVVGATCLILGLRAYGIEAFKVAGLLIILVIGGPIVIGWIACLANRTFPTGTIIMLFGILALALFGYVLAHARKHGEHGGARMPRPRVRALPPPPHDDADQDADW